MYLHDEVTYVAATNPPLLMLASHEETLVCASEAVDLTVMLVLGLKQVPDTDPM